MLFEACDGPDCTVMKETVPLASNAEDLQQLKSLFSCIFYPNKESGHGKSRGLSFVPTVSRGKTRAHEVLQCDILSPVFQYCPRSCPIPPTRQAAADEKQE
eukprot:IDg11248t1